MGQAAPNQILRQADWKLVGEASTLVSTNRIYYARVPSETKRWQSRLTSYDRDSSLQQNFSHTGLLAIFLTSRAIGFTIEGVFTREDGSLTVQIRAAPPPPPVPECHPNPGEGCATPIIPGTVGTPLYLLIAIRKGSLPAPIQRLYITEVPNTDPPRSAPGPAPIGAGPFDSESIPTKPAVRPAWTRNCTALHRRFPHGVGKVGARDRTKGTPVTNFRRSNRLFRVAMSYNRGLDRDHDGIACEQA